MSGPLVSVVIAAHDAELYLGEAVNSVLAQTYRSFEVVVVDDGSGDRTAELARHFGPPVHCHSQPWGGIGAARNRGIEVASGQYVAFLDADDLWQPHKLERQLAAFEQRPQPAIVFGMLDEFSDGDVNGAERVTSSPQLVPGYLPSAMIAPREIFIKVGHFAVDLRIGEFIDWMARARELGLRESVVPEHVLSRRIHGENHTRRHREALSDLPRILKAALDRRRDL